MKIRGKLGLNEDVSIGGVQYCIADELLCHRDGLLHGHTQIREVVQKSGDRLQNNIFYVFFIGAGRVNR